MGSITSSPSIKSIPQMTRQAVYTPPAAPNPADKAPDAKNGDQEASQTPDAVANENAQEKRRAAPAINLLERARRGRNSLITTSLRGLLNSANTARKSLLGE